MATIASKGLTPEAVWAGLRPDWLITEEARGRNGKRGKGGKDERDGFEKAVYAAQTNKAINQQWFDQVSHRRRQLENYRPSPCTLPPSPLVLIAETHPSDVLASFLAAALAGWSIALANPRWGTQEWKSLSQLISPNVIFGENTPIEPTRWVKKHPPTTNPPAILIPTGGSSGQVKLAHHTWASLMASVTGFRQHFAPNGGPIHTVCVLPVHHVSGLMQVLRAWTSHAQVTLTPFKTLEANPLHLRPDPPIPNPPRPVAEGSRNAQSEAKPTRSVAAGVRPFISLVPTQLHRLLQANQGPWLSQFQAVLLGGAPPWPTLLARAAQHHIPLYLSYGMTETAAMVTAVKIKSLPSQAKQLSSGKALPHATIEIVQDGRQLAPGEMGQVVVHSSAIAQGYYPPSDATSEHPSDIPPEHLSGPPLSANFSPGTFYTDDLGYLNTEGHLYITGRASSKIISGGENIFPAEVEAALRSTGLVTDVCIIGQSHELWGEVVTAVYVPTDKSVSPEQLKQALCATDPHNAPILSRYKHPKRWIPLAALPRNEQGKLDRAQLLDLIPAQLDPPASPKAQPSADDGDAHRP